MKHTELCPDLAALPVAQVGTPEEMAALRRIEAAAPELLAALETVAAGFVHPEIAAQVHAAIAKARGG